MAGDVGDREDRDDAGDCAGRGSVDAVERAAGDGAADEADEQLAGHARHVVDVERLAGHVADGRNRAGWFCRRWALFDWVAELNGRDDRTKWIYWMKKEENEKT